MSEIAETIDEYFLGRGYLPMGVGSGVPPDYYNRFKDTYPEGLFYAWRRFGFDGFGDGKVWLTDPVLWQPAVDAWLDQVQLPFQDTFSCVMRSACGTMALWGRRTGLSLTVDVQYARLFPLDNSTKCDEEGFKERIIRALFLAPVDDGEDHYGKPMFETGLSRLGKLSATTMYGYEPALVLGGDDNADRFVIVDAVPHLQVLASFGEQQLMADITAVIREVESR